MSKKTNKELRKQVETLQTQNKMLEEELRRIRQRITVNSDSNDTKSDNIRYNDTNTNTKHWSNTIESDDSSNYSSLIDLNQDMSQKMTDMQKQLSIALLENAKLKKSISYTESENASLIAENHDLKWQVASFSKDSDILNEKDTELDSLRKQLKKVKSEANQYSQMAKENIIFKQEVENYHLKLTKHKEELKKAKKEIERLTAKNNESDNQIAQMEKYLKSKKEETLQFYKKNQNLLDDFQQRQINQLKIASVKNQSLSEFSSSSSTSESTSFEDLFNLPDDCPDYQRKLVHDLNEIKAFCTSLRDENYSLKNEVRHLREKLKDAKAYFQHEYFLSYDDQHQPKYANNRIMNRQYSVKSMSNQPRNQEFALSPASKSIISRRMNNFMIKVELLNSKILTKFDHLTLKWKNFETSLRQASSYRKERLRLYSLTSNDSKEQFVSNLNRQLRIIDTLTRSFAKSKNIPPNAIPNPRELLGDSDILNSFLDQNEYKPKKSRR